MKTKTTTTKKKKGKKKNIKNNKAIKPRQKDEKETKKEADKNCKIPGTNQQRSQLFSRPPRHVHSVRVSGTAAPVHRGCFVLHGQR